MTELITCLILRNHGGERERFSPNAREIILEVCLLSLLYTNRRKEATLAPLKIPLVQRNTLIFIANSRSEPISWATRALLRPLFCREEASFPDSKTMPQNDGV